MCSSTHHAIQSNQLKVFIQMSELFGHVIMEVAAIQMAVQLHAEWGGVNRDPPSFP